MSPTRRSALMVGLVALAGLGGTLGPNIAQAAMLHYAGAGSQFLTIDGGTGNATVVNPNVGVFMTSLAFDGNTGVLYGTGDDGGSPFFTVDPSNGNRTVINPDIGPAIKTADFDNASHTLYAVAYGGGLPRRLGSIDLGTGAYTQVSADIGRDIYGMAFDDNGILYGIGGGASTPLVTIDPATGLENAVINPDIGPSALALTFDWATQQLLVVTFQGGTNRWSSIDRTTGNLTQINANIGFAAGALAAPYLVPEPGSLALAAIGTATLGCSFWRRCRHRTK